MSEKPADIVAVTMPQINVNDEEVTLLAWCVEDGGAATSGQSLCEVETSKSVGEVPAPATGVVRHLSSIGDTILTGQTIACIGPSREALDDHLLALAEPGAAANRPESLRVSEPAPPPRGSYESAVAASAGAIALAREHGIDPTIVPTSGRLQRADVERYLAEHPELRRRSVSPTPRHAEPSLPEALRETVQDEDELPDHLWSIACHLKATQSRVVSAQVVMDVPATAAVAWMDARRRAGQMVGPIPLLLHAIAAAVKAQPMLGSFRIGRRVYRYRAIDIAYTARSADGRLFTPVVRAVDGLSLDELARQCARLNMAVFRGQLAAIDMLGGCLTVSALSDTPVRFHLGLQNAWQSALITAGAIREEAVVTDGQISVQQVITLALTYDHGLMDGWQAAAALDAARMALNVIQP